MEDTSQDIILKAFKVILVGTQSVGKSSILCRLISSEFPSVYQATVGIDYHTYNQTINNKNYCLQIWDTAGQQKFRALTSTYYKNCNGCLCVYDITDKQSIQKCEYYLTKAIQQDIPTSCTVMVGNKIDLLPKQPTQLKKQQIPNESERGIEKNEQVQDSEQVHKGQQQQQKQQQDIQNKEVIDYSKEAQQMAEKYGIEHVKVSAKTGFNINQIFNDLTLSIIKHFGGAVSSANFQLLPKLKITQRKQNCKC